MDISTMWHNIATFGKRFFDGIIPVWEWLITPMSGFQDAFHIDIAPIWLLTGSFLTAWVVFIIAKELIEI